MNEQVKMSDENIIYCLQTLAGFEPNDIDCDDFDIAVNDDQFATISIVETARLGYELTEKQKELISKQEERLKIMRDCIAEIRSSVLTLSEIDAMCDKVINHAKLANDKLTQAEQIKILREALQLVDGNDDKLKQSWFDCGHQKVIDAALSATEQK